MSENAGENNNGNTAGGGSSGDVTGTERPNPMALIAAGIDNLAIASEDILLTGEISLKTWALITANNALGRVNPSIAVVQHMMSKLT